MKTRKLERILVMPSAGLGDLVMAAPVIRNLRELFPKALISVLGHHARGAGILGKAMPCVDEVIDFPLVRYSWISVLDFFSRDFWSMLKELESRRFQAVLILGANPIRSLIAYMLLPELVLTAGKAGHPTLSGLELVSRLGGSATPKGYDLIFKDADLEGYFPSSLPRPWIGLHPFAAMSWRTWEHYPEFIQQADAFSGTIFLFGRGMDHTVQKGCVDLVNRINLEETLALIKKLDLLVSTDSGPMHLGFAADIPVVALFGLVPPELRLPLNLSSKIRSIYRGESQSLRRIQVKERFFSSTNYLKLILANEVFQEAAILLKEIKSD